MSTDNDRLSGVAKYLARRIDRSVYKSIFRAVQAVVKNPSLAEPDGLSVEVFLATLYLVHGKRILHLFAPAEDFLRMQRELLPGPHPNAVRRFLERWQMRSSVFLRYSNDLRDLLWNAIRISAALNKRRAGIPEVMAALCLNDELVADLKKRRGFVPVAYVQWITLPPREQR